jgi:hypothetical protein
MLNQDQRDQPRLSSRSWICAGLESLTCKFVSMGWKFCALAGALMAVGWVGVPVRADGADVVRRDGGADRLLLPPWFAGDRAPGSAHSGAEVELLKAAARVPRRTSPLTRAGVSRQTRITG